MVEKQSFLWAYLDIIACICINAARNPICFGVHPTGLDPSTKSKPR